MDDSEFKEFLLSVAKATDDRIEDSGFKPEPPYGIITMVLAANGGEMDETVLSAMSLTLDKAAQVAGITGRQPIYEFVADVLVEVSK